MKGSFSLKGLPWQFDPDALNVSEINVSLWPMQITDDLLEKVCRLAKLEIPTDKRAQMKADFQKMLDFVDRLQAVDTENVEPLIHMTEEINRTREDIPQTALSREQGLHNAPSRNDAFFQNNGDIISGGSTALKIGSYLYISQVFEPYLVRAKLQ